MSRNVLKVYVVAVAFLCKYGLFEEGISVKSRVNRIQEISIKEISVRFSFRSSCVIQLLKSLVQVEVEGKLEGVLGHS
ncbi:hypothetical protein ACET3Z_002938 [Daucus carota]